jgi:hypothetical protein
MFHVSGNPHLRVTCGTPELHTTLGRLCWSRYKVPGKFLTGKYPTCSVTQQPSKVIVNHVLKLIDPQNRTCKIKWFLAVELLLYVNGNCFTLFDKDNWMLFSDPSVKGIVSKLTVKFWMCQKCGKMKDYNTKMTTNTVEWLQTH